MLIFLELIQICDAKNDLSLFIRNSSFCQDLLHLKYISNYMSAVNQYLSVNKIYVVVKTLFITNNVCKIICIIIMKLNTMATLFVNKEGQMTSEVQDKSNYSWE